MISIMELVTYYCDLCDGEAVDHFDAVFNGSRYDLCKECNTYLTESFEGKGTPEPAFPPVPFLSAFKIVDNGLLNGTSVKGGQCRSIF